MVDELQDIGDAWLRRGWDTKQAQILVCVFKCFTVVQVIVNIQASRKYIILLLLMLMIFCHGMIIGCV